MGAVPQTSVLVVDDDGKSLMAMQELLQQPGLTKVRRNIVPSALPYNITGLRLSLRGGWRVLSAAESDSK